MSKSCMSTLRIGAMFLMICGASAAQAGAASESAGGVPNPDDLSDDFLFLQIVASRDYCKKVDPDQSAAYDKGFAFLTADSPNELTAFLAKPDTAEAVAKRVTDFEARDKNPETAGSGKSMCENYIKMQ